MSEEAHATMEVAKQLTLINLSLYSLAYDSCEDEANKAQFQKMYLELAKEVEPNDSE